jgi:hypothetical protein
MSFGRTLTSRRPRTRLKGLPAAGRLLALGHPVASFDVPTRHSVRESVDHAPFHGWPSPLPPERSAMIEWRRISGSGLSNCAFMVTPPCE